MRTSVPAALAALALALPVAVHRRRAGPGRGDLRGDQPEHRAGRRRDRPARELHRQPGRGDRRPATRSARSRSQPSFGFLTATTRVPATTKPGDYQVRLRCPDGQTATSKLHVVARVDAGPGPGDRLRRHRARPLGADADRRRPRRDRRRPGARGRVPAAPPPRLRPAMSAPGRVRRAEPRRCGRSRSCPARGCRSRWSASAPPRSSPGRRGRPPPRASLGARGRSARRPASPRAAGRAGAAARSPIGWIAAGAGLRRPVLRRHGPGQRHRLRHLELVPRARRAAAAGVPGARTEPPGPPDHPVDQGGGADPGGGAGRRTARSTCHR